MKKLDSFFEYKFVKKLFLIVPDNNLLEMKDFIVKFIDIPEFTISVKKKRIDLLMDLFIKYQSITDVFSNYNLYNNSSSTKEKLLIRYGESKVEEYSSSFKSRKRGKVVSRYTIEYWIKKGFSEKDSIEKISEIQKNNSLKRTPDSYKNFSTKTKLSVDYWINLGYNLNEANKLRTPFVDQCKNDLCSYIKKYGIDIGTKKYEDRCLNYKVSMSLNKQNRKSGGYVSKESLKFFVPLYKFCRRLGISKTSIYFGISGSKEYFIRDNTLSFNGGKFYDFCIPSINLIIEYNGSFWHPRTKESWRNPYIDFDSAIISEKYKRELCELRGFNMFEVWSDDNKLDKFTFLCNYITEKYYDR